MKNTIIPLSKLRNTEHFQFHTDVILLIDKTEAEVLDISDELLAYKAALKVEDDLLILSAKNENTASISAQDHLRDDAFTAIMETLRFVQKRGKANASDAASRLLLRLEKYPKNLTLLPLQQETGAITQVLQDLKAESAAADIALLELGDLLTQLQSTNDAVANLMVTRIEDTANRSAGEMMDARRNTDEAYLTAIEYAVASGLHKRLPPSYLKFMEALNSLINSYQTVLNRRKGNPKKEESSIAPQGENPTQA